MARVRRTFHYQELPCRLCGTSFKAARIDAMWCPDCKAIRRKEISVAAEHRHKGPCSVCDKPTARRSSLCLACENRRRATAYLGDNNPNWQGGRILDDKGYVHIRVKPNGRNPYRPEHRLVWEKTHGKPLPKGWAVHHLNGVKDDNRPENLLGVSRRDHHTQHRVYEARIRQLEEEVRALRPGKRHGTEPCAYPYCETPCERPCDLSAPGLQDN